MKAKKKAMVFEELAVGSCVPSPTNPRKSFDQAELAELVDSITEMGVLEPILVRPTAADSYEIIAGERRWRAARAAGLSTIPSIVRAGLSDCDVIEIQVTENSQRADVTPLEEARAFKSLLDLGRNVESIAERIGRAPSYVRHRLALLDLVPEASEWLAAGRITVGSAMAIAQLSTSQQAELVKSFAWFKRPISREQVANAIQVFARRIALAVWPLDEEIGGRVACERCPKRSSSQRSLLVELEQDDLCLDGACWNAKGEAYAKTAAASGVDVADYEVHMDAFVTLDELDDDVEETLKSRARPPTSIVRKHDGSLERAFRADHLADALESAGAPDLAKHVRQTQGLAVQFYLERNSCRTPHADQDTPPATTSAGTKAAEEHAAAEAKEAKAAESRVLAAQLACLDELIVDITREVEASVPPPWQQLEFMRCLARHWWTRAWAEHTNEVAQRRGWDKSGMDSVFDKMTLSECYSVLVELSCTWSRGAALRNDDTRRPGALREFAGILEIDVDKRLRTARRLAKQAKSKKAPAKTKGARNAHA
jgi:ParB/RepB/Spo0J family partition protein